MTWEESLFAAFDDLEQQAEGVFAAEREAELAERSVAEYRGVTLASRLMASTDREVALDLPGAGTVRGTLARVGPDWCLLSGPRQDWVIRLAGVSGVRGASARSRPEAAWSPVDALGLASALRRLVQAGERCVLRTTDGDAREALLLRVGADFVEAVPWSRPRDQPWLVPLAALVAVQEPEPGR